MKLSEIFNIFFVCAFYSNRLEYGQRWKTSKRGHFSVEDLIRVGTKNGATSLGLKGKVGEIRPGYEADFVILDTKASDFGNDQGPLVGNEFLASALYEFGQASRKVKVWRQGIEKKFP